MEVYALPLSEVGEPIPTGKGQFIKLPPPADTPYILRFVIFSASEVVNKGVLHCNVPPPGVEFQRLKYYTYPIHASFHEETHIDITIASPGAFSYFITYIPINDPYFNPDYVDINLTELNFEDGTDYPGSDDLRRNYSATSLSALQESPYASSTNLPYLATTSGRSLTVPTHENSDVISLQQDRKEGDDDDFADDSYARSCTKKFYFIVSAGFEIDGQPLSLNALNIESVVSKWMGPVDTWRDKMVQIKQKGYNMIHFTPLQARGSSNSPYSIYDQLQFDKKCFPNGEKDVEYLVNVMEHEIHLLSLTDVVFNHTAHNSEWLKDHPESGYSSKTAPHLTPAVEIDTSLLEFSANLRALGYPTQLYSIDDLNKIMEGIKVHVIGPVKLWEYYVVNVDSMRDAVLAEWKKAQDNPNNIEQIAVPEKARIDLAKLAVFTVENTGINFSKFGHARYIKTLNTSRFLAIIVSVLCAGGVSPSNDEISKKATAVLNEINLPLYQEYDTDVNEILTQLFNRIKYTRIDSNGPKFGEITVDHPLIETYFTRVKTRPRGEIVALANNGWIWNGNPLVDFASAKSKAYLRREVIVWGDCVKLRYGNHPSDSPYLWDRMTRYTQLMAKYFHGFRIDNCHSTPLHVGEYMLDKARLVRNNLYVVAELFTGSEDMDKIFVERLGITSLIREAMQAWSVEELSRLVHRHGGRPIGSFSRQPMYTFEEIITNQPLGDDQDTFKLVRSSNIHALFMDCTHDNMTPAQKRTVEDTLPNAALVSMCSCAVGSVMGYDECYPELLEIVTETRQYTFGGGIGKIKKILYDVHTSMGQEQAEEMHVHHEGQYISVHRVNPRTGEGWFLIARTKFGAEGDQRCE